MVVRTAPTARGAGAPNKQAATAPVARAFRIGALEHEESNHDQTLTMSASTQDYSVIAINNTGFLRHLWLIVNGTVPSTNSATVATATLEDAPFSVLDTVTLEDVQSAPIVGPIGGFDLYLINKYGGYAHQEDPTHLATFSTVEAGSGATGGNFSFVLRVPVELVNRDGLGALPNKSGNSQYKLRIRLAASTAIYTTAPTALPGIRLRVAQDSYFDPDATDLLGNPVEQEPPGVQTTQFWSKNTYSLSSGSVNIKLDRVGYLIRNLVFILRGTTNPTTAGRDNGDTDWPDPAILFYEAQELINRYKAVWNEKVAQDYNLPLAPVLTTAAASLDARDGGVFVLPFNKDFGHKPGAESRRGYLPTHPATRLEWRGTVGTTVAAHTLTVLTNDVWPSGDQSRYIV